MKVIYSAILAAQREIEKVEKSSRNDFAQFNYASAESMIAECRIALHSAGLAVHCSARELILADDGVRTLRSTYAIIHESGECIESIHDLAVVEKKGTPLDKATLGAATESLGYYLRDLLLVPRQEVDVSGRDDRSHEPRKRTQKKASKKKEEARDPGDEEEVESKINRWIADAWGDAEALKGVAKKIAEAKKDLSPGAVDRVRANYAKAREG